MAKVNETTNRDGSTSYRVRWVLGGGRPIPGARADQPGGQPSETFTDEKLMRAFKAAVEAQDNQWPRGWVKGRGWVSQDEQAAPALTLDEVYERWCDADLDKISLRRKKPKTIKRDRRTYELHLQPTFGGRPVTAITRQDVQAWVQRMSKLGAAPKSIRNRHGLLAGIMKYAQLELEQRYDNPCDGTPLPADEIDRQIMFFTHGEWGLVFRCLRSDVKLMVEVALTTAIRWGELAAVRVGDISITPDQSTLHIHIQRAWSERAEELDDSPIKWTEGETRKHILGAPKNRRARWVSLSGTLAQRVLWEIAGKGQDEYLFTTSRGNPWRYEDFHTDRWTPAIKLAKQHGLAKHGTIHMLRHTAVVWSLADGMSIEKVSEMLGHASIQITYDRYGGLLNLKDAEMAQRMAKQLLVAEKAILPIHMSEAEVDSRPVRTRARRLEVAS